MIKCARKPFLTEKGVGAFTLSVRKIIINQKGQYLSCHHRLVCIAESGSKKVDNVDYNDKYLLSRPLGPLIPHNVLPIPLIVSDSHVVGNRYHPRMRLDVKFFTV